jgi:hypothetical protein
MAMTARLVRDFAVVLAAVILMLCSSLRPGHAQQSQTRGLQRQGKVALVVGNGAYAHLPPLANPRNDARLIADTLKDLGFSLVGGGPQLDLDKPGFDRAVQGLGQALANADIGMFYYAGHGLQVQGKNWLVPIGANPAGAQDLDFQMVDADLVLKQMQFASTRLNFLILDACRNNPFGGRGLRDASAGLAQMRAPDGTLIAFATEPGRAARDGDGADSPYSTALARAMRQPGLDVFQLFNQVGLAVKRETGGDQQPWQSSSPIDGDFFFSGVGRDGAAPPAADPDLVFWQSIATSTNPAEYRAYLEQFPNGRFAALARQRAEQSRQQEALVIPPPGPLHATPPPATAALRPFSLYAAGVQAINVASTSLDESFRDYTHLFNPDRGPTGREHLNPPFQSVSGPSDDVRPAIADLKRALAEEAGGGPARTFFLELHEPDPRPPGSPQPPAAPDGGTSLPGAARRYIDAAEALLALLDPAVAYYAQDRQSYIDDNFARGKAMHPALMAAFRNFEAASEALRKVLQDGAASARDAYVARIQAEHRTLRFQVAASSAQFRRLIGLIRAGSNDGRDFRRIDAAALKAQLDVTVQRKADVQDLVARDPGSVERDYGIDGTEFMAYYMSDTDQIVIASRFLLDSLRGRGAIAAASVGIGDHKPYDLLWRFNQILDYENHWSALP